MKTPEPMQGRDTGVDPEMPEMESGDTPEAVVRRLLQTHSGDSTPPQPAPAPEPGAAPRPPAARSRPILALASRLTATPRRAVAGAFHRVRRSVLAYRPAPRHAALLILALVVLTMPWLIPALVLLCLTLVVISYLSLGHDRSGELIAAWYERLMRRNPDGAEALRARAARLSAGLSALAGYLPARWTSGLYLPDFAQPDDNALDLSGDPFDRLADDTNSV